MNEKNSNVNNQEFSITFGDVMNTLFCKKILMLIIVAIVTLVGTLSLQFAYDKAHQIYTTRFNLNAIDLEEGVYIDGSKFDYREMISLTNLNKAKATDEKFESIDTEGIVQSGAISISFNVVYDQEVLNAEKKAVVKDQYYEIKINRSAIGNEKLAREFVDTLVNIPIKENASKNQAADYTSNLVSYDASNRYDAQIEHLLAQLDMINEGYETLIENYGNVVSNGNNLTGYSKKAQTYFNEYAFANLQGELNQYGYIKDYEQNGRIYYIAIINDIDQYKVGKLKLDQLIAQRDEVLNKYAQMGGTIENTGLDAIYVQIADLSTELEDYKQNIRINLRRLASKYERSALETEFAEALTILDMTDATKIYADIEKGNETEFKANLALFREKLGEFTEEYKTVSNDVVSTYSSVYYKDSSVIVVSGGLGTVKDLCISLAAGFFIACIVNLILGRERLSFEYRMRRAIDRKKQYGLMLNEGQETK